MGVFRQFPYSNFHEMNMDEIIKIIKNMLEEWAQYHAEWETWKNQLTNDWSNYQEVMNTAWQNMQNFINNYFDNLDVQTEINNKIIAMVRSGEFSQIVDPYVPPAVAEWLAEHVTTPGTIVIDDSLTIEGAAADAKATGDAIRLLEEYTTILNLFDSSSVVSGGYFGGSGQINADENSYYSEQYIPVEADVLYKWTNDNDSIYIATYNSNKVFISRVDPDGNTHAFNNGVAFVRLSLYHNSFATDFKFAKETDFNDAPDIYERLILGNKIVTRSIPYDALNDNAILGVVGKLATENYAVELGKTNSLYSRIPGYFFNTQGELESSTAYTTLYFVAPNDFTVWGDTNTTSGADADLMIMKYSETPLNSAHSISSRMRQARDSSEIITANTLPTSAEPLTVQRGEILAIAYDFRTDFALNVNGLIDGYTINNNVTYYQSGIGVSVGTDYYNINLNDFEINLEHEVDAENRKDLWAIRGITKGSQVICSSGTDIIGVLQEVGEADFMGGLHGDETNVDFYILGDGSPILTDGTFNQVDVLMYSHLTRPSTGDNVIDRVVHIVFKDNYIDIENTFICLVNDFHLSFAYNGGMFAWYDADASFQMSNVGVIESGGGDSGITLQNSSELYSATAIIGTNVITIENIVGKEKASYLGETYYYGSSDKRIKMYYATDHNSIWNTGHICKGKARYTLN